MAKDTFTICYDYTYKFLWLPKRCLNKNQSNQSKAQIRWLSWQVIETRYEIHNVSKYWGNIEDYIKYYDIYHNESARYFLVKFPKRPRKKAA